MGQLGQGRRWRRRRLGFAATLGVASAGIVLRKAAMEAKAAVAAGMMVKAQSHGSRLFGGDERV